MSNKISVIIPTYNRPKLLSDTILSLKRQNYSNYEILVVDNACSEDIRLLVERQRTDQDRDKYSLKYIQSSQLGLHNARHAGAKAAEGEILLYIDDDVIVDENLIKEIIKPFSDQEVGCVGGKILPNWEIEPPEWINQIPKWYFSILDDNQGPKELKWIYGCNFAIRKELLFSLGGFNPDAFGERGLWWYRGDGENGLLRKVHKTQKKIIYNPRAVAWHFIPKERISVAYVKERAFKTGIEEAFLKYFYHEKSFYKIRLPIYSFLFFTKYMYYMALALVFKKRHMTYIRKTSYYKSRFLYELRIAIDKNLQELIKKKKMPF